MSFTPRAPRGGGVASSHKRKGQTMIDFHKSIASGVAVGILVMYVLAASAPASARGGGGSGGSRGPGRPPPPVFVDGSAAGRALGSSCSISRKPVTDGVGSVTGYRRVQVCNLD